MTVLLHSSPIRAATGRTFVLAALALMSACAGPSADSRRLEPTGPLAAKAAAGPTVTSTIPRYSERGTTVDVRVVGTGFTAGAQATWLLRGVANPAKVRTNGTTFVSSTEVVANITVSSDADLALWDVQVALAGGKNGVGTEVHEVSTAENLGQATFVNGLNDAGQIAGINNAGAFVYDDAFGMLNLGAGQASGVDPLGSMVLGRNASDLVTAWVRQGATTTYVAELLPTIAGSVGGNAIGAARDSAGALLVAGWQIMPTGKRGATQNRPVLWRHDGSWSAPIPYVLPAGFATGAARDVNGRGQLVGRLDASDRGAVWENATTVTVLDGLPNAINAAGTIVVGVRAGVPVYWHRTSAGTWNIAGVVLPSLLGICGGEARDVNDAGFIVGLSCEASNRRQGSVWRLDLSSATPTLLSGPQRLPGLGLVGQTGNEGSSPTRITNSAPLVIVGTANAPGGAAARWQSW